MKNLDIFTKHRLLKDMEYTPIKKLVQTQPNNLTTIIFTQNVRSFTKKDISDWMYSWRRGGSEYCAHIIFLQETHIVSTKERDEVTNKWAILWGQTNQTKTLSYWSVHPSKQGGVAILICPTLADQISPCFQTHWTNRVIAVTWNDCTLKNLYGPSSDVASRESFYGDIRKLFPRKPMNCIVGGDFDCVDTSALDRMGGNRSIRPESNALSRPIAAWQLWDARLLMIPVLEELQIDPSDHYTFWRGNQASRIDRFYVSAQLKTWVV